MSMRKYRSKTTKQKCRNTDSRLLTGSSHAPRYSCSLLHVRHAQVDGLVQSEHSYRIHNRGEWQFFMSTPGKNESRNHVFFSLHTKNIGMPSTGYRNGQFDLWLLKASQHCRSSHDYMRNVHNEGRNHTFLLTTLFCAVVYTVYCSCVCLWEKSGLLEILSPCFLLLITFSSFLKTSWSGSGVFKINKRLIELKVKIKKIHVQIFGIIVEAILELRVYCNELVGWETIIAPNEVMF